MRVGEKIVDKLQYKTSCLFVCFSSLNKLVILAWYCQIKKKCPSFFMVIKIDAILQLLLFSIEYNNCFGMKRKP